MLNNVSKRIICFIVIATFFIIMMSPAMPFIYSVEAVQYTINNDTKIVSYDFEDADFADGVTQDSNSLKVDGTSSHLLFTDNGIVTVSNKTVTNSPIANVVSISNGKSRSSLFNYYDQNYYSNLTQGHNNVLRFGADGNLSNISGGVLFNNGTKSLSLDAGKYIIGFDYYVTSTSTVEKTKLSIINNLNNYVEENGRYCIGDNYSTVKNVLDSDNIISGSWQTVAYTVEIKKHSNNIGFYVTDLDGEIFIDNINVSLISTICFESECDILPISGEPGTQVELPDAGDVIVTGKQFEGWYSDPSFESPITGTTYTLPTNALSVKLFAKMSSDNNVVADFNFDNGEYAKFKCNNTVDGKQVSGVYFGIANNVNGNDGNSLKFSPTRNIYDGNNRSIAFNNGSHWFTLEPGTYDVSYKYMLKDRNSSQFSYYANYSSKAPELKFVSFSKSSFNYASNTTHNNLSDNLFDLTDASTDDGWHSKTIQIVIGGTQPVCFGLRAGNFYFDVYLDDIVISKPFIKEVTVTFETSGGSSVESTTGVVGSEFYVKDPTKKGFIFAGWYTDAALQTPADNRYPQDDAIYYAKWVDTSSTTITFDSRFKTGTINAGLASGTVFSIKGAPDDSENKTLAIAVDRSQYDGNLRAIKFNNGIDFITLCSGDHVELTYNYLITDRQGDPNNTKGNYSSYSAEKDAPEVYFLEGMTGNTATTINGTKSREDGKDPIQLVDIKTDEVNKWHTKTVKIDIIKDGVVGISSKNVWADLYFDNFTIKVTKPKQVTVSFNSCGGSVCESQTVGAGVEIVLPKPTRDGYTFAGWYTEENGDGTKATSFAPQEDTTYYARWVNSNTTIIDFENDIKQGATDVVGSSYFKCGNSDPTHGKVLIFESVNNLARARMLTEEAKILPNTDYIITFEYNIKSLPSSKDFEFDFATNLGKDGKPAYEGYTRMSSINLLSDATSNNTSVVGKWRKVKLAIHTPDEVGSGYLAVFAKNGLDAVIWFDNMEITQLDQNTNPVLYIDYGYNGITDIIDGSVGSVYNLGVPVTREGYSFEGWFDANGNEITSVTFPSYGIIYAYALWLDMTPTIVTFDDMPDKFLINEGSKFVTAKCFSIVDGLGKNGTKALKYSGDSGWKYQALNNADTNFIVKKDTTYMVKIRYYRESGDDSVSLKFITGRSNNYFASQQEQSSSIKLNSVKSSWQELTLFLTSKSDNSLFLGINGTNNTTLYFDDIEFRELSRKDVVLTFATEETGESSYLIGKKGTMINSKDIPVVNVKNYTFMGWFLDKTFISSFKGNVFPAQSMTVYAKLDPSSPFVIDFTDYPYENDTSSLKISSSIMSISRGGPSKDGDGCALSIDNTKDTQTTELKRILIGAGSAAYPLQKGTDYLISYSYYIDQPADAGTLQIGFASSFIRNMFAYFESFDEATQTIRMNLKEEKKWYTSSAVISVPESINNNTGLVATIKLSLDTKVYLDDIKITTIEPGCSALVYASEIGNPPKAKIVKNGTSVNVEKMSDAGDYRFVGWYYGADNSRLDQKSIILDKSIQLNAGFSVKSFTEDFENTSYQYDFGEKGYEPDWEIYDSTLNGNSKNNVHAGRFSLHRLGSDPSFRAYCIYSNNKMSSYTLYPAATYTVSMWVKIENPVHKLGAIEIISSTTPYVPWSFEGDKNAIVAITDIADGEWHKIEYTFQTVTHYISIVTPGNLSIYIDDVSIEYAEDKEIDIPVVFEQYIPKFLDKDGKYIIETNKLSAYKVVAGEGALSFDKLADFTDSSLFVVIIVCGVLSFLSICATSVVFIFKKKGGK